MRGTYVVDMQHFLEEGGLAANMPTPALNLVLHMGAIVSWMTSRESVGVQRTNVPCRRSPGRRRCATEILAVFESPSAAIVWACPVCGDNGHISGWQETHWDRSPAVEERREQLMNEIAALSEGERARIDEGQTVRVTFTADERVLLEEVVLDPRYLARLMPILGSTDLVGEYTLEDLDDVIGHISIEANHAEDPRRGKQLHAFRKRLWQVLRSYDDGNWADSED